MLGGFVDGRHQPGELGIKQLGTGHHAQQDSREEQMDCTRDKEMRSDEEKNLSLL